MAKALIKQMQSKCNNDQVVANEAIRAICSMTGLKKHVSSSLLCIRVGQKMKDTIEKNVPIDKE